MATINELFISAINKGFESAKGIIEPQQKASAYSDLAKAIALTGRVTLGIENNDIETVSKDELSEIPKATKEEVKEEVKEEAKEEVKEEAKEAPKKKSPAPSPVKEVELRDEWDDEMIELKKEAVENLSAYREEFDEDSLNGAVQIFSENVLSSLDDISPLNIDAFLAYLDSLMEQE